MKLCVVQISCKEWDGTVPVPVGIALTDMESVCVPQVHTIGLRIQGEPLVVSLRLKTLLSKLVEATASWSSEALTFSSLCGSALYQTYVTGWRNVDM